MSKIDDFVNNELDMEGMDSDVVQAAIMETYTVCWNVVRDVPIEELIELLTPSDLHVLKLLKNCPNSVDALVRFIHMLILADDDTE